MIITQSDIEDRLTHKHNDEDEIINEDDDVIEEEEMETIDEKEKREILKE